MLYSLHTVFLFIYSDIFTIIIPQTLFAVLSTLSGSMLTSNPRPIPLQVLCQTPIIVFWIWINLLPFVIDNQRQKEAIAEDLLNKPWRPLPSNRLSPGAARTLMLIIYPCTALTGLLIGGAFQCFAGIALGYWYNSLRAADENYMVRNLANTCGFLTFSSGSMLVLSRRLLSSIQSSAYLWLLVVGGVVFTTVQIQDIPDQAGDRIRGAGQLLSY